MLAGFLFVCYGFFFSWFFHKLASKNLPGIRLWQSAAIYLFKVALACCYGYIFLHSYGGDDTWNFFLDSLPETDKLFHHPAIFFHDFLPAAAFHEAHSFSEGISFYFRNLEYWIIVKSLAIFNIFSKGNYYIDVLFFEFMTIWGQVLLMRLLLASFPAKRNILLITIFFVPSLSFWISGIRAEAMLILCIGMTLFHTWQFLHHRKFSNLLWVLAAMAGFLIFRVQFFLVFLPAYACWIITFKDKRKAHRRFLLIYITCILLFFVGIGLFPGNRWVMPVIHVQEKFMALHGNTRLPLDSLRPTFGGILHVFPQALANTFLRPWITEAKGLLQIATAVEIMGLWVLVIFFFVFPVKDRAQILRDPLLLLMLFYGLSQILVIGFIVPFPGAIVRYKAIPELFLVITLGLSIDWSKLYNI